MEKEILNQILPLIIAFIVALLTYCIKMIGNSIISYLVKKENLLEHQIGKAKFEKELALGRMIWNLVEENFRVADLQKNRINKANIFDEEIRKILPYLDNSQIIAIRQAVAGEMNLGKTLLTDGELKDKLNNIKNENINIKTENEKLQNKINKFSKIISNLDINILEEKNSSNTDSECNSIN